jgi:protein TonB
MLILVLFAASIKLIAQSDNLSPTQPGNPNATPPQASEPSRPKDSAQGSPSPTSSPKPGDSVRLEPIKTPKADYPIRAAQEGIQGQVWVKAFISETGDVDSVEVISGDKMLAEAAVAAAKKWKFRPFIKDGKPVKIATKIPFSFAFSDKVTDTTPPPSAAKDSGGSAGGGSAQGENKNVVQVPQGVSAGLLIHKVAPVYPESARRNHVQGTVVLQASIDKDGRIADLTPISGPKELIPAAVGAVQQWRYKPYLLEGKPVAVKTEIVVNFRLQ